MVLRGELSLDEAVTLLRRHTRRFVRQQYNWFRLSDPSIHWFDRKQLDINAIRTLVIMFLAGTALEKAQTDVD